MRLFWGLLATVLFIQQAEAKPARCFSSDDGHYACDFRGVEGNGSFIISAPNKPTITLMMDQAGVAYGFEEFSGGRNVRLPGQYFRSRQDPACWINNETNTKICAW